MDVSFTPVVAGNRRSQRRKLARMIGESGPRMRPIARYLVENGPSYRPMFAPGYRVKVTRDGRAFLDYRPLKRTIPEHERPSAVVVSK